LETLFSKYPKLNFRIIGADPYRLPRFEKVQFSSVLQYSREQMVDELSKMDIAIFPMYRNDDALARGNLKTKIYMSSGLPVVVQNIGESVNIIKNGEDGFLVDTNEEWLKALTLLIENPTLRREIGERARKKMLHYYSTKNSFEKLVDTFEEFLG
jgi:glycosyltransferase involved in cell wall biosynthesis